MDKSVEPIAAAIKKVFELHTEQAKQDAFGGELGLYLAAEVKKQQVAAKRLLAFSKLPRTNERSKQDVLFAAELLEMEPSNVYRLLKRVKEFGPVSGLLPGHRVKPKSGAATDGFGEPVDTWIADVLRSRGNASVSEIAKALTSKAKLGKVRDPSAVIDLPTLASLRRRVHALRSRGLAGHELQPLGEMILVDQCWTRVHVPSAQNPDLPPQRHRVSVTLIVDEQTSIILGCGAFVGADAIAGLRSALEDLTLRSLHLEEAGMRLSPTPSRVRWTIPPALLTFANEIEQNAATSDPSIELVQMAADDDRSGVELHRSLGGRLGPFDLLTRVDPHDEPSRATIHQDFFSLSDVTDAFRSAVTSRNHRILGKGSKQLRSSPPSRSGSFLLSQTMFKLFETRKIESNIEAGRRG